MRAPRKENRLYLFCLAFFFLIASHFSFAVSPREDKHFQFPHFFSQSPDDKDKYLLHFSKGVMQFSNEGVAFQIIKTTHAEKDFENPDAILQTGDAFSESVQLNFKGSNSNCFLHGSEPLASRSNYFLGNNNSNWKSDLQNYNALLYKNLYNDVDLKYYVLNGEVKYDYTIQPGGNIASIKMKYSGIKSLLVNKDGTLCITTHLTELKDYLPKSYQIINGKEVPVKVHYRLLDGATVGFTTEQYNKNYPLIIDPALIYSTFVGGSSDDYEYTGGISLDATGNIYVTGRTFSPNFPTTAGAYQTGWGGNMDAFVFKLNPTGTALVFSTFVGGNDVDAGYTTKIDPVTNDVYVAGTTASLNFPTTAGAFHTAYAGGLYDPFCFKLNSSGSAFVYSTLMGNAQDDYGASLEIDNLGNAYVVGQSSGVYPTTAGAYQSAYAGGPWDIFVTKLNPTGSAVIFSTMIGGPNEDHCHSIQVDGNYDVYIAGFAQSGYPTTAGAYDVTYNGGQWDIYVTKINSTGTALIYSTFVGGSGGEWSWNGLEIDNAGNAYVAGYAPAGFPTTAGAFQTAYGGGAFDAFVFKLNPTGSSLVYSTYVGGTGDDEAWGISLNPNNEVFITGLCSFSYPYTPCAWDTTFNGVQDAFITYINSTGSSLLYSSYIGGAAYDQGYNIIDVGNLVYVAGATSSVDFPHSVGAYDTTWNGAKDIMVFEMDISGVITVTANFNSIASVCLNGSIQFNNTSVNATTYNWDFGDGGTSTLQNPLHTFTTSGLHNVRLIATASCALPDTFIVPVNISDPPVAAFVSNVPCGLTANFTDGSTGAISYAWNFGDAATSASPSPSHTYSIAGNYPVTLIVTNAAGCVDTLQQQVIVSAPSAAAFTFTPPQCTLNVSLQNTSANASTYSWNFGDGTTSTNASPAHTYTDTGTYTIMLITDPGVCADTTSQSVTLHLPPVASFTSVPGCNLVCNFINTTTGAVSFSWNFGDASTSSSPSPTHTYSVGGNYPVSLIATNSFGCSDTILNSIIINPPAVAAFTFNAPQCMLPVSFQNTSANATSLLWNFGDGNTTTATNPTHTFSDSGSYSVTLIANPNQCPDTITQTITLHGLPVAAFSDVPSCNYSCTFINSSIGGVSYTWNFGDASSSIQTAPLHTYPLAGNYFVSLITTDLFGCTDTAQQSIIISNNAVAGFTAAPPPCTLTASFQNTSANTTSYQWIFGDGSSSTDVNPVHVYAISGTYPVMLITDPAGCADTMIQQVTVSRAPVADFTNVGNCTFTMAFQNTSDSADTYTWSFGDGASDVAASPAHTYTSTGNFNVTLTGINSAGCTDTITKQVSVVVFSPAGFVTAYDTCSMQAQFTGTSANSSSSYWYFGDGATSASQAAVHQYAQAGTYPLVFITNRGTICADTLAVAFKATEDPQHGLYIPNCFTPNGDGLNERFTVIDFSKCETYHLLIFNRWGQLVFESDDLSNTWDGRYKGVAVPEDVYAWILKGDHTYRQGSVTVVK